MDGFQKMVNIEIVKFNLIFFFYVFAVKKLLYIYFFPLSEKVRWNCLLFKPKLIKIFSDFREV